MSSDRQIIADQIADLARMCGGSLTTVCCGHGHYEQMVAFDGLEWTKFIVELSKIIGKLTDGQVDCESAQGSSQEGIRSARREKVSDA